MHKNWRHPVLHNSWVISDITHLAHLEWPFPYLLGVGLVLRLHSVRSRATSWVKPTAVMSSFSCWFHVFLGRPRRLVPGMARLITLRVTLSASRLWTCPNQRRRPQRITSSIGVMFRMRRLSSFRTWSRFDTPWIPRSIVISVVAIFLLLVTFIAQHSLPYVRDGLIMASYTFALSMRGIIRSYNTPVHFLQLDHAARTLRSTSLYMVPSLSITDPRYLKWSTFFSSSPFTLIGNGLSLVDICSVFATLILRPLSDNTFCHNSSLFWVSVLVMSIIARSSAYSSSLGRSVRTSRDIVSTSMMNRNGLSAEPWWRPITTSNCSLMPLFDFTRVVAPWYIYCTSIMYPSGMFRFACISIVPRGAL